MLDRRRRPEGSRRRSARAAHIRGDVPRPEAATDDNAGPVGRVVYDRTEKFSPRQNRRTTRQGGTVPVRDRFRMEYSSSSRLISVAVRHHSCQDLRDRTFRSRNTPMRRHRICRRAAALRSFEHASWITCHGLAELSDIITYSIAYCQTVPRTRIWIIDRDMPFHAARRSPTVISRRRRAPRSAIVDRGARGLRSWEHCVVVRRFRMKPLCCQPVSPANAGVSGS